MKISLNTILTIFGAAQTVVEVVGSTIKIVKKKNKEKAPASEEDTEAEVKE